MLVGLSIALVVESVAVHALIGKRWPIADLVLIVTNVWTLWYLRRHYRAVGENPVVVDNEGILIRHGLSISARVPWSQVVAVTRPEWKDQPTDATRHFLKLSGGDDPNILVRVDPPVVTSLMAGLKRQVALFGLRLDDPAGFVSAVDRDSRISGRDG